MGIDMDCEVFNLFADLFCASDKAMIDGSGYRVRQGLVPDFCPPRLSDQCPKALAELKGITLSKSHYPRVGNTHVLGHLEAALSSFREHWAQQAAGPEQGQGQGQAGC